MSGKYRTNFLKNVTVRLDFTKNLYQISSELPSTLKAKAQELLPHMQRKGALAEEMMVKCEGEVQRRHVKENHWFFTGGRGDKTLCIAPNFMWLDCKTYSGYQDLRDTVVPLMEALFEGFPEVPDLAINRFGLRYFNSIEFTDPALTDWTGFLNPALLSIFSLADDRAAIARAFHNLEMNYGDMYLTFLYGMYNFEYPAPIRQKTFTLDYDGYIARIQQRDELPASLDSLHGKISSYFENSITDKLRDVMGR